MTGSTGNAPAWLFAFVDLAFLLLLGMTQLPGSPNAPEPGQTSSPSASPSPTERAMRIDTYPFPAMGSPCELRLYGSSPECTAEIAAWSQYKAAAK